MYTPQGPLLCAGPQLAHAWTPQVGCAPRTTSHKQVHCAPQRCMTCFLAFSHAIT